MKFDEWHVYKPAVSNGWCTINNTSDTEICTMYCTREENSLEVARFISDAPFMYDMLNDITTKAISYNSKTTKAQLKGLLCDCFELAQMGVHLWEQKEVIE